LYKIPRLIKSDFLTNKNIKMERLSKVVFLALIAIIGLKSCSDDDPIITSESLNLNISGLENLGPDYAYEGWIIVDGSPKSAGIFTVDDSGVFSKTSFELDAEDLAAASAYVLTIEPSPDSDPSPSAVHILAGDFNGNSSTLTVEHGSAIGDNFENASGGYILATPTDDDDSNETSGVWWLDPSAGPGAGLSLPSLPSGWIYEGWVVLNGTPLSTGKFSNATGADDFNGFSGANIGPSFPGEDLLNNAPANQSFPTDIRGGAVVISVEPIPDNSAAPFALKPLFHAVPSGAADHSFINMDNNATATNPSGSVSR